MSGAQAVRTHRAGRSADASTATGTETRRAPSLSFTTRRGRHDSCHDWTPKRIVQESAMQMTNPKKEKRRSAAQMLVEVMRDLSAMHLLRTVFATASRWHLFGYLSGAPLWRQAAELLEIP